MTRSFSLFTIALLAAVLFACGTPNNNAERHDPLPSWQNGEAKSHILQFVKETTDEGSAAFIPVADRIAVFDNDGTLWSEKPAYFQLFFVLDRIQAMAPMHPEWDTLQPYKAALSGDMKSLAMQGEAALLTLVLTAGSGINTSEYDQLVREWSRKALHPVKKVKFTELVYKPMIELLDYLRTNQFKTYIVSGGGVDFMRATVQDIYGIPAEQIIGTTIKTEFTMDGETPQIMRLPEIFFVDDKEGKPLAIQRIIGKKPVFSAGNSDGDLAMLQWTASGDRKSFMMYIHHTDSVREWAYDSTSSVGRLKAGLGEAQQKGWTVVDMKNDWSTVYPGDIK